ncbi:MAG: hypothetical protein FWD71_03445 [Oscillospiraceae bacterium]|nr:hypothetical protein [Oscillospiraceae bacterium]
MKTTKIMKRISNRIISLVLAIIMSFGVLPFTMLAVSAADITWNDISDPAVAIDLNGIQNTERNNSSGQSIPSNAHSADFPKIYFAWVGTSDKESYLKIDASLFSDFKTLVVTAQENSSYYDFKIEKPDQAPIDGYYVFHLNKPGAQDFNQVWTIKGEFVPNLGITKDIYKGVYTSSINLSNLTNTSDWDNSWTFDLKDGYTTDDYALFKITVSNNTIVDAKNVILSDKTLASDGITELNGTWYSNNSPLTQFDVAAGSSEPFYYIVPIGNELDTYTNTATIIENNGYPSDTLSAEASFTVIDTTPQPVPKPDITVTKEVSADPYDSAKNIGDYTNWIDSTAPIPTFVLDSNEEVTVLYKITVKNDGDADATVDITDSISGGAWLDSIGGTTTAPTDVSVTKNGGTTVFYYTVTFDKAGTYQNTATATDKDNNIKDGDVTVDVKDAGLTVTKTIVDPADAVVTLDPDVATEQKVVYKIVVRNSGNVDLTGVVLTEDGITPPTNGTVTGGAWVTDTTTYTDNNYNSGKVNGYGIAIGTLTAATHESQTFYYQATLSAIPENLDEPDNDYATYTNTASAVGYVGAKEFDATSLEVPIAVIQSPVVSPNKAFVSITKKVAADSYEAVSAQYNDINDYENYTDWHDSTTLNSGDTALFKITLTNTGLAGGTVKLSDIFNGTDLADEDYLNLTDPTSIEIDGAAQATTPTTVIIYATAKVINNNTTDQETWDNVAAITADDSDIIDSKHDSDTASVIVNPELAITKQVAQYTTANGSDYSKYTFQPTTLSLPLNNRRAVYEITITNNGNMAIDFTLTDIFSNGTSNTDITDKLGTIPTSIGIDADKTITLYYTTGTLNTNSTYVNTATITYGNNITKSSSVNVTTPSDKPYIIPDEPNIIIIPQDTPVDNTPADGITPTGNPVYPEKTTVPVTEPSTEATTVEPTTEPVTTEESTESITDASVPLATLAPEEEGTVESTFIEASVPLATLAPEEAKLNPQTGDNTMLIMFMIAVMGICAVIIKRKISVKK